MQDQLQYIHNQIIDSISKSWKEALRRNLQNIENVVFQGHLFIKNHQTYCLKIMNSKEVCGILNKPGDLKPSSQFYSKNIFRNFNLHLKNIYVLPRIVTKDASL